MKEHKKLYKAGKKWVIATVMTVAAGTALAATNASANETDNSSNTPAVSLQQEPTSSTANYNQDYQTNAPAITVDTSTAPSATNSATRTDANGVESTFTVNANNKNTNQTTSVTAGQNDTKALLNSNTATDINATITIINNTGSDQQIGWSYSLPAWNGTQAQLVVDGSKVTTNSQGVAQFGGNYVDSDVVLRYFAVATGDTSSSGFGDLNNATAAAHPELIAGFAVTGTIHNGQTVTIVVPLKMVNDESVQLPGGTNTLGIFGGGYQIHLRQTQLVSNLNNQTGKRYFLVDMTNPSTDGYHSVPQSVINALNKDGVYPTYQDGDIQISNYDWYNTNNTQDYLSYDSYVDYSNAMSRLQSILNQYGYEIVPMGSKTGLSNAYNYQKDAKYYDAQGNQIALGQGDLSNFFLAVQQDIKQNGSLVLDQGGHTDISTLFENPEDPGNFVVTGTVDQSKEGVYPVLVSTKNGKVSRHFNIVVVAYKNADAYKSSDSEHQDLQPSDLLTATSVQNLEDQGYQLSFAQDPDYTTAGEQPVQIVMTDSDGNQHVGSSTINVLQRMNVEFVDPTTHEVVTTIPVRATVGETLQDAESQLLDSSAYQQLLSDYNIDLSGVLNTEFLAQAADQTVVVNLAAKPKDVLPVVPDQPGDNTDNNKPSDNNNTDQPGNNTNNGGQNGGQTNQPAGGQSGNNQANAGQNGAANNQQTQTNVAQANGSEQSAANKAQELPQTGNGDNVVAMGLGVAAMISMLGLGVLEKKHN